MREIGLIVKALSMVEQGVLFRICGLARLHPEVAFVFSLFMHPPGNSARGSRISIWLFLLAAWTLVLTEGLRAAGTETAPAASAEGACLPFDMPSADVFFASRRKVFAHYFSPLPLSFDNKEANVDYYATQYLNPAGENGKWLAHGGYLRTRPLPVPVVRGGNFLVENLKREVRLALSRGITGFAFDILGLGDLRPGSALLNLIKAAAEVDSRFQIMLMPDMSAFGPDTEPVSKIVRSLYDEPRLSRLADGRLVVAPFWSEGIDAEGWKSLLDGLSRDGLNIALILTFLNQKYIPQYLTVGDGYGTFGTPLPTKRGDIEIGAAASNRQGKLFMAGISGQGYRPKNYRYWESQGSLAYRSSWLGAIHSRTEWIQLTTWNDFGETTQVAPFTDADGSAGTGYFNLTGYYATWFATGAPPPLTHDVLYYFHRRQSVDAIARKAGSQAKNAVFFQPGKDMIEVLGFLTAPGSLVVSIDGRSYRKAVDSGVQSFSVPLQNGKPRFSLVRDGRTVIEFEGNTPISTGAETVNGYADLTYWTGSASAAGTCFSIGIP